jgi:hypothetical protein
MKIVGRMKKMKVMKGNRKKNGKDDKTIVVVVMSVEEAKQLKKDLITSIGQKKKPKTIAEQLTNKLSEMFNGEDVSNDEY